MNTFKDDLPLLVLACLAAVLFPFWTPLAIIIALVSGHFLVPFLRRLKAGQAIREEGPKSHLKKGGTPTIGGIIFLFSTLLVSLLAIKMPATDVLMILFTTFAFGAVGFIDDYIKVIKNRNLGLTAEQKLSLQILVAIVIIGYEFIKGEPTSILIPGLDRTVDLGWFYVPFIIFVVVGTVNSVNLTDGLDGLSSSVTIIVMVFFYIVSVKLGAYSIATFCIVLAGSLLGFLFYNKYPAKVFMGDTGSLALGGAVVSVAILLKLPLILPLACGVYFMETLSVIIQVVSFKTTGRRVFKMSPLHHHFEESGWKETKVVSAFVLAQLVLCVISYILLFM
ncbi:phospho-N-acetylmuramoyl-pentapeptide-transferase [Peptoniphilus equinus]|uniref:Phospho-N-acetylmuramoyl-pentapeptide-transferase n=1 Tax=Peptoniphilus equinus TaxID=3016343 RepID=A0ABY7QS28_9FIRM|nr:phospho-N-acetylmuramoyl-pentapeptide-transferase [Peptoniphilus equinus]WBW49271.1 phospho-N-acetylmuramoyl-pentapeptide-transferase [Peptoniphilus equinus]